MGGAVVNLGLSKAQLAKRRHSIGASDAGRIMSGEWAQLWLEKTGRKEPDDLSGVLPVQLGSHTEAFNRFWWTRQTGIEVTDAGMECAHPDLPFLTCTLDGRVALAAGLAVFEAKHVGGREPFDTVVARYMPQVHHQMHVTVMDWAVLSVLISNDRWEYREIPLDPFYLAELIEREKAFWQHVETDTPPPDMPAIAAPVPPELMRHVDMTGRNEWASFAAQWLESQGAAKQFAAAEKGIKALMEADVSRAFGHSIECKRAKNGSLRIGAV